MTRRKRLLRPRELPVHSSLQKQRCHPRIIAIYRRPHSKRIPCNPHMIERFPRGRRLARRFILRNGGSLPVPGAGDGELNSQNAPASIVSVMTPTPPHKAPEMSCSRSSGVRGGRLRGGSILSLISCLSVPVCRSLRRAVSQNWRSSRSSTIRNEAGFTRVRFFGIGPLNGPNDLLILNVEQHKLR